MSLKGLIKNQTIIIDDHKRGSGEIKDWNNQASDIHIDKSTNFPIYGKRQDIRIRVPLNSNRAIKLESFTRKQKNYIPKKLLKEINSAFEDKETRENFMVDLIHILKDFNLILDSEQKVRMILDKLSRHFNLKWSDEKITIYSRDILQKYTELYLDEKNREYFITVETNRIIIGQNNGYAKNKYFEKA